MSKQIIKSSTSNKQTAKQTNKILLKKEKVIEVLKDRVYYEKNKNKLSNAHNRLGAKTGLSRAKQTLR